MIEMIYQPTRKCEILYSGTYKEHKFAILNLGTHPTAYVECKLDNCNSYGDFRLVDIDVHFGFTYMGGAYWDKDDKTAYIGWDYAHYTDYVGYYETRSYSYDAKKWTTKEIYREVENVIDQLLEIERGADNG